MDTGSGGLEAGDLLRGAVQRASHIRSQLVQLREQAFVAAAHAGPRAAAVPVPEAGCLESPGGGDAPQSYQLLMHPLVAGANIKDSKASQQPHAYALPMAHGGQQAGGLLKRFGDSSPGLAKGELRAAPKSSEKGSKGVQHSDGSWSIPASRQQQQLAQQLEWTPAAEAHAAMLAGADAGSFDAVLAALRAEAELAQLPVSQLPLPEARQLPPSPSTFHGGSRSQLSARQPVPAGSASWGSTRSACSGASSRSTARGTPQQAGSTGSGQGTRAGSAMGAGLTWRRQQQQQLQQQAANKRRQQPLPTFDQHEVEQQLKEKMQQVNIAARHAESRGRSGGSAPPGVPRLALGLLGRGGGGASGGGQPQSGLKSGRKSGRPSGRENAGQQQQQLLALPHPEQQAQPLSARGSRSQKAAPQRPGSQPKSSRTAAYSQQRHRRQQVAAANSARTGDTSDIHNYLPLGRDERCSVSPGAASVLAPLPTPSGRKASHVSVSALMAGSAGTASGDAGAAAAQGDLAVQQARHTSFSVSDVAAPTGADEAELPARGEFIAIRPEGGVGRVEGKVAVPPQTQATPRPTSSAAGGASTPPSSGKKGGGMMGRLLGSLPSPFKSSPFTSRFQSPPATPLERGAAPAAAAAAAAVDTYAAAAAGTAASPSHSQSGSSGRVSMAGRGSPAVPHSGTKRHGGTNAGRKRSKSEAVGEEEPASVKKHSPAGGNLGKQLQRNIEAAGDGLAAALAGLLAEVREPAQAAAGAAGAAGAKEQAHLVALAAGPSCSGSLSKLPLPGEVAVPQAGGTAGGTADEELPSQSVWVASPRDSEAEQQQAAQQQQQQQQRVQQVAPQQPAVAHMQRPPIPTAPGAPGTAAGAAVATPRSVAGMPTPRYAAVPVSATPLGAAAAAAGTPRGVYAAAAAAAGGTPRGAGVPVATPRSVTTPRMGITGVHLGLSGVPTSPCMVPASVLAAAAVEASPRPLITPRRRAACLEPPEAGLRLRDDVQGKALLAAAPAMAEKTGAAVLDDVRQGVLVRKAWVRPNFKQGGSVRPLQLAPGSGGRAEVLYPHGLFRKPLRFAVRRAVVNCASWQPGAYLVLDTARGMLRLEPYNAAEHARWVLALNAAFLASGAVPPGLSRTTASPLGASSTSAPGSGGASGGATVMADGMQLAVGDMRWSPAILFA